MKIKQNERKLGKFKQGQTIYAIHLETVNNVFSPFLVSYFLHSHKALLPKAGEIITDMNQSYLNWIIAVNGSCNIFLSKRKAKSHLKKEARFWKQAEQVS
jgi:hypothetical protein